jgi:formiminotetrahydrofolate cyclodeaminase
VGQTTQSIDLSCTEFVEVLASSAPAPGGGGAAALVGAIGVALGNMVGSLTVGKAKYADVQDDIIALKAKADELQSELLALVAKDAEVFEPLARAYGMPKATEEEAAKKRMVMEDCLRQCVAVPLHIMEFCTKAIELHAEFAAKGTAIALSDVGCGVAICKAALEAASLNVFINTMSMTDRVYADEMNALAEDMLDRYTLKADAIFADVAERLRK